MSAPVALRSLYSDLYGSSQLPVLEYVFRAELMNHPSVRDMVLNEKQTDRDIWQYSELHDLDLFSAISEGSDYQFKRANQGASKTMTVVKYGLGVSVSEEAVSDGKLDLIGDMVRKLAKSARESQEISAMNLLNNGFTATTGTLSADLNQWFYSAHTLPSGLTFRNTLSTASDLSPSSLDTAMADFETQMIGDSNIKYMIKPRYLVVPSGLKRYAKQIVKSSNLADTADNNINPFLDDDLMVVASPYLTDSDAWFLAAAPGNLAENGALKVIREGIQTKAAGPDVGFVNDAIFYKCRYREVLGVVHPYGWFGSPGA